MDTQKLIDYLDKNLERFKEELKFFIAIESVSADSRRALEIKKAAEFLEEQFNDFQFETKIYETEGHPIVYAQSMKAGEDKPTVLLYGHYDVQPEDPIDEWNSEPFELTEKDGRMFARGSADDKGQVFMHLKVIEAFVKEHGELPFNLKVIIEGEEEVGSESLETFLEEHKDMLKADFVLISDTAFVANNHPSISVGLRGINYFQIDLQTANSDLHSGQFGGAVANPAHILARILAKLHDEDNKVTIPEFYRDVLEADEETQKAMDELAKNPSHFLENEAKAFGLEGEKEFNHVEQIWVRPTCEVNGVLSGYAGEGAKTVLPAKAMAKVSMRLVPNQDPKHIEEQFTKYIKELCPDFVDLKVTCFQGGKPYLAPLDHPIYEKAKAALNSFWPDKEVMFTREGGSIPIVETFESKLGLFSLLMGFAHPDDNIHGPNENLELSHFTGGMKALVHFYSSIPE